LTFFAGEEIKSMQSPIESPPVSLLSALEIWIVDPESERFTRQTIWPSQGEDAEVSIPLDDSCEFAQLARAAKMEARLNSQGELELFWPTLISGNLAAVTRLVWQVPADVSLAFERWTRTERDELAIDQSWYQGLETLERISGCIRFPRGSGLPGMAWARRQPLVADQLADNPDFMRTVGRDVLCSLTGIALPCMRGEYDLESVVLLMNSQESPFALGWECWLVEEEPAKLMRGESIYTGLTQTESLPQALPLGEGVVGAAYLSRLPTLSTDLSGCEHHRRLAELSVTTYLAQPIFNGERLVAVLGILF